jgi:hypothetical protein
LLATDVLGNAYMSLFFKVSHSIADLDRAKQAYQRAVRGPHGVTGALSAVTWWR